MKKTLYLIRHGLVRQYDHTQLNENGIEFASKLPNIIDCSYINFIASVKGKDRCKETIKKIDEKYHPIYKEFDSNQFKNLIPLQEALKYENSVICYGYEEVIEILNEFKIKIENKDELYEIILKIYLENKTYQKIPTGYSKTKEL